MAFGGFLLVRGLVRVWSCVLSTYGQWWIEVVATRVTGFGGRSDRAEELLSLPRGVSQRADEQPGEPALQGPPPLNGGA